MFQQPTLAAGKKNFTDSLPLITCFLRSYYQEVRKSIAAFGFRPDITMSSVIARILHTVSERNISQLRNRHSACLTVIQHSQSDLIPNWRAAAQR
jgi:hypothetical protein